MTDRLYVWGECPRCGAITEEPCADLRYADRRRMPITVHRERPAHEVARTRPAAD